MGKLNSKTHAEIHVSIPILKNLSDKGFPLNVGALTLSLDNRNFILDAAETNFTNPGKKGKKLTFSSDLFVDKEVFEEGDEYNYKLTLEDLTNKDLKAEFYCSDSDVGIDNAFDFEGVEIECVVYVKDKPYEINVELE